jgi:Protein of unknown function (DUF4031)
MTMSTALSRLRIVKAELEYYCDTMRHLVCVPYSVENLHAMAANLGIKRCWFHSGDFAHYDVPKRRIKEIMDKCTVMKPRDILSIIKK